MSFQRVLVANRGEIAVRILRGLKEAGLESVAVYSDADRAALHTRCADFAVPIGPAPSAESYLNIGRIIDAAQRSNAGAIHPGYGFLSENADFAQACEDAGLVFIGPSAQTIRTMGSKTQARAVAERAGAPILPGTRTGISDLGDARSIAESSGYPVMVKAAGGGGGKGMRRVDSDPALESALREASSEAERSFGNPEVYIEKLLERPRHVEIQILGDRRGHVIHLGERECSLQRRHQKVVEESPSPLMIQNPELREEMGDAALRIARQAGYYNAGTMEFLVDERGSFYFLEMNTRLQVEHAVTEMVTGVDLVRWQLRIAAGLPLTLEQQDITWRGAAVQCRVYAEDPDNGFFPSPGRLTGLKLPAGPGVRVDSGVYEGWNVPVDYDPLLAKLIAWAPSRAEALSRMAAAVDETSIGGIRTNLNFFRHLLRDTDLLEGRLHTGFISEFLSRSKPEAPPEHLQVAAALVAAARRAGSDASPSSLPIKERSEWLSAGRATLMR
ncbi:MAG TPA: acetyl-CoA carboxylase biotin carboxylase subunit [Bryobacteraceae bacterium]|nr:acetyl-CoA carboxylase biotin carboxylase subunit [Bryobacteraceae bacterium]